MTAAVNPHIGQVAVPSPNAPGYVVGRLGARAMVWIEQSTGKAIDDIFGDITDRMEAVAKGASTRVILPVATSATILWAGIEHERRMERGPGPEFTIEDAYDLVEHIGLDEAYTYALALLQLSMPFKKRLEHLEQLTAEAGMENPGDPLRAVAVKAAGTGMPTSPQPSPPASPTPPPGS